MAVAVFDLDVTLIDCNSGTLWLRREWREGRVGVGDGLWAAWSLFQYSLGAGQIDHVLDRVVATLEGLEEAEIEARTARWFAEEVAHRLRPGARAALDRHRAVGDQLVLATSGSIYSARLAAAAFGLDHPIGSTFEVVGGRFTGKTAASAFGGAKATRVVEWAALNGVDLAEAVFYTDSAHDLALLERVGKAVAVHPDRVLRRIAAERGWEIVDWGKAT